MAGITELQKKYKNSNLMDLEVLEQLRADLKAVDPEDVRSAEDHQVFLGLVKSFRTGLAKSDTLKGDNCPNLLTSLLSVGEDGVYSNNLRFLYELIQNVDDCEFEDPANANLAVKFDPLNSRIILTYNEKGFTPFNVFAITGIAEAAKNISADKVEIGEKGIGFKSVFGVASKVLIQSGLFSFELHKDNFTIPVPSYDNFSPISGTRLTLYVRKGMVDSIYSAFFNKYCHKDALFNNNPLMFLNKLTTLRLYLDDWRSMIFAVSRSIDQYPDGLTYEEDVKIAADLKESRSGYNVDIQQEVICRRYTKPVYYDHKTCQSRYGTKTPFDNKRMIMQIVVPAVEDLYGNDPISKGTLYSFLPTQIKLTVPLVCHVPFKLDGSREYVDPQKENAWFAHSQEAFAVMVKEMLLDLSHRIDEDIIHYVPKRNKHLFLMDNEKVACLMKPQFHNNGYLELPIFKSVENHFRTASEVFCFPISEEVPEPEITYLLLGESKELFLPSKRALDKNPGIQLVTQVANKLFGQAMRVPEHTTESLAVLTQMKDFNFIKAIEGIYPYSFTIEQLAAFARFPQCIEAFQKHAVGLLKKSQSPTYTISPDGLSFLDVKQLDPKDPLEISDFDTNAARYLNLIGYRYVLIPDTPDNFYFICGNVLALSMNKPIHALSWFCRSTDEKGTFSATLQFRSASRTLNEASEDMSVAEYMKLLINVRKVIRSSFGAGVYDNYISLINQSGTDPDRYLSELLQNADDCNYPEGVVPTFRLQINENGTSIRTQYNECGFQRDHVRSITAIGESTKKRLNTGKISTLNDIGEKGIGFKAVFGVARRVDIHSGPFHFALTDTKPTIPEQIRNPSEEITGTQMIFTLKKHINPDLFSEANILSLCMCLRKLRILQIGSNFVEIIDDGSVRTIRINRKKYAFTIIRHPFVIHDSVALEERGCHQREIQAQQEIRCYIPQNSMKREQFLYTGLPTKVISKIHMVIDAPYDLTTDRSGILTNRWNDLVTEAVTDAILRTIDQLKAEQGIDTLRYVNFRKEGDRYQLDLFSDPSLNTAAFLTKLKNTPFLPTFEHNCYARPNDFLYRIPDVIRYLLVHKEVGNYRANQFITAEENRYEMQLAALGIRELNMNAVINMLRPVLTRYIQDPDFRTKLYGYLNSHLFEISPFRDVLKTLRIIPVKGSHSGVIDYISWNNNIYAKDGAAVSPANYHLLATDLLSKQQFSNIFGNGVNELDSKVELMYYQDALAHKIDTTHDSLKLYAYLINEFNTNFSMLAKCKDMLVGRRHLIPLKNEFGILRRGRIYVSDVPKDYFSDTFFHKHIADPECRRFAQLIECKNIVDVHFEDLDIQHALSEDDIDFLQSEESLKHGYEILEVCKRKGLIPPELRSELNIDGLSPVVEESDPDEIDTLFNDPIENSYQFHKHMQTVLADSADIIHKDVIRSVRYIRYRDGKEKELQNSDIRNGAIQRYSLSHRGLCICQMCQTAVRPQYVKVNNVFKNRTRYWKECGLTFCLMCSKHYEELRQNDDIHGRFLNAIRLANTSSPGALFVPIGNEKIRFSQKHIAELQEIMEIDD